jgi:signal transduction histidine kinase
MNEVSCKVFTILFKPLSAKGVATETIVQGTPVAAAQLRNRKERISWTHYVQIMKNVRPHFTDDEYVELGREWMRSPGLRFAFVVARLLFTPMDFYRWMNKPREGVGNQMFTCIVPKHRELSANEIELDLTLPDGFEVCWDFYVISRGNMEELPRLLGLPPAKVDLNRLPNGARFRITVPMRRPLLGRVWRALTWPFTAHAAGRELKEAHETLLERYEELEVARAKVDRQAVQLRTAHTINALIHGDLDLDRTLTTITRALVDEAGFDAVELEVKPSEGEPRTVSHGTASEVEPLHRVLQVQGARAIGELRVVPRADADRTEREELLEFVVPTLSMALHNALAYRELGQYQVGLERLVDERTAELRQARDELTGTVAQLREAQQARQLFFGNISHEIRTPLSLILLAAADIELRAGAALDERGRRSLGAVGDAARKLVRLVDELLLLAAGQEGKLTIHPEPSDLVSLVQALGAAWRPAAEAAGLELAVRVPDALVAQIDPVALERVATNLVSNAVKYTPRGGRVELELACDADTVRLSVLDTGPGIDAELASRLFGRFERAAGVQRRQIGTGLGLSLVKQLVEAHGGTVAALAREPHGAELRVVLPGAAIERPVELPGITQLRIAGVAVPATGGITSGTRFDPPGLPQGTIVLAEDDPRLAEATARMLGEEYTVHVGLDGIAALELVRRHQPQMLVSDVAMPGMNGIELAKRFREVTGDRLAPIVILSAVIDLGTRVAGLEAGAVDYVMKPFEPTELRARVRAQFRMRELAVRLHRAEQVSTLGILTSGLAHELRNPANGIVNAIAPLRAALPPALTSADTGAGQLLEIMEECAQQIGELSRQLLGFRHGSTELLVRATPVADLVRRAAMVAQRPLEGVELRRDLVDAIVSCAPSLIVQVLANLIENAAHAAGRGGWVEVGARTSHDTVFLEVSDSGPGVPVDLRDRVFEPFFTTKAPGVGTGLGLSVARAIAQRHGGTLELTARGERHVFVLSLPGVSRVAKSAGAL